MIAVRLLLFIGVLAGLIQGQTLRTGARGMMPAKASPAESDYAKLDAADLAACPGSYRGKLVTITAEVVSVDAKYQAIRLYDARAKALIGVSLSRLPKAQRRALVLDPVYRVSVYGSVNAQTGKCLINAHKVVPASPEPIMREAGR